ncbi:uncharacterized protein C9orf85 homolog isoform X2 [Sphaerodactylus townsendi]|uniref:uncharacterized protein C9orf85 homolog isoform X2 n=1 Tax=Sphaerodactylus townsendi TaxID=933632 RepID=UPI002025E97C|nr:uncharacterized protein C9orf85 homolog isoform X2 [Sphaerodactylus townsendi]
MILVPCARCVTWVGCRVIFSLLLTGELWVRLRRKLNAKQHEGLCQHCKEVLEWRVKFNKYKPLTKPKKCVKCLQKTVKDSYHIVCKPCACELDLCAKCGKSEKIVMPIQMSPMMTKNQPAGNDQQRKSAGVNLEDGDGLNLADLEDEDGPDLLIQGIKNLTPERTEVK